MGVTRFPNGISSFGVPVLGGNYIPPTKGNYYWVDSNHTMNGTGDFDNPFTTVVSAISASTANNDDVIIMKQGHAESITAAGTWTPKASTTIVGLGFGTRKPLITWSTATTATCLVSSANVTFINFDTTTAKDELVTCFAVQASNCTLLGVNYRETSTSYQAITWLTTTAAGTFLTVRNCRLMQLTAPAGNGFAITMTGADDAVIQDNLFFWNGTDNAGSGSIGGVTTESLRVFIVGNITVNPAGTTGYSIHTLNSTTGIIANNRAGNPNAGGSIATGNAIGATENYSAAVTKGGTLDPAA